MNHIKDISFDEFWSCYRKYRYKSKGSAKRGKQKLYGKNGKPMNIYACEYCSGYHLASRKKK